MSSDRDAIAQALQRLWDSPEFDNATDEETGALIAGTLQPFVAAARDEGFERGCRESADFAADATAQARAEGYQAAISDARKAVDALRREWGTGTNPESADYGDPQVQQFGEFVLAVFDKPDAQPEAATDTLAPDP